MTTNMRTIKVADIKARLNYHASRITVQCPNGHLVAHVLIDADYAGSYAESELSARGNGRSNAYDRLAQQCAIDDAAERRS